MAQAEAGLVNSEGILISGALKGKKPKYSKFLPSLKLLANEGRLMRGIESLLVRGAGFSAGSMLGYDYVKTKSKSLGVTDGPVLHVASAVGSAIGAACFSTPPDAVMTRYQAGAVMGNKFDSQRQCIEWIYK